MHVRWLIEPSFGPRIAVPPSEHVYERSCRELRFGLLTCVCRIKPGAEAPSDMAANSH